MIKIILTLSFILFINTSLHAGENYSEMSTQELISIMGYVKANEVKKFKKELESRKEKMNPNEKENYKKNLKKLKEL